MRMKGKLIKWDADKAFGFIQPNGGGEHIFIHKTALENRSRTPQVNDVITFSLTKITKVGIALTKLLFQVKSQRRVRLKRRVSSQFT